jgi:hypothetical protein
MIYAQIKGGQKLHLAYEPGEGPAPDTLVPAGHLSAPICGQRTFNGHYRMTINLPLAHACKNCLRVARARS